MAKYAFAGTSSTLDNTNYMQTKRGARVKVTSRMSVDPMMASARTTSIRAEIQGIALRRVVDEIDTVACIHEFPMSNLWGLA